jgi:hypothetical protein
MIEVDQKLRGIYHSQQILLLIQIFNSSNNLLSVCKSESEITGYCIA